MNVCPYCGEFTGQKFDRYLRHIKFVHSNEPNFTISCTYCGQVFKKYSSYKSHLDRKHKQECAQDHLTDGDDHDNVDHEMDDATAVPIADEDQALIYNRMDNASGLKTEARSKSANADVEAPLYYRFILRNDSFCGFFAVTR